ncbi:hypothetical protein LINGRAHAP2_LOCUS36492 [Linum grandiflorum]
MVHLSIQKAKSLLAVLLETI